ncbi:hypothetical protein EM595_0085 [Duffyella gerundensis]|uniref:Uncharacterized protein n=1 Tax=Duffyella gerundensis TaxID=1619313 RepID=A0A0U5GHK6_9GAMM|nr:hypothetical protein EM595_0085 [Duffyella gerundensis]
MQRHDSRHYRTQSGNETAQLTRALKNITPSEIIHSV